MSHSVVLRESGRASDLEVDLRALVVPGLDIGVPNGGALMGFCDALLLSDGDTLARARDELVAAMGGEAVVAASAIAANFSKNDRIANATGIPLEAMFIRESDDYRSALGIDDYLSARNSLDR